MKNTKVTSIVISAIIGLGIGTGGTLVYENHHDAAQLAKIE